MTTEKPRDLSEVMRDEMVMRPRIAAALAEGPKTIPEIAEGIGCPDYEVTFWVMAMRRYGAVEELPKGKSDDYYRYGLVG